MYGHTLSNKTRVKYVAITKDGRYVTETSGHDPQVLLEMTQRWWSATDRLVKRDSAAGRRAVRQHKTDLNTEILNRKEMF